jgi:hypothetical protein
MGGGYSLGRYKNSLDIILKRYIINNSGCWEYTGFRDSFGYGVCNQGTIHRLSYEYYIEPIPKGLYVLHKCDNPACFNPDHLFLGTQRDNMVDCAIKGRIGKSKVPLKKILVIYNCKGTNKNIGKVFNVHYSTVRNIRNLKYNYFKLKG